MKISSINTYNNFNHYNQKSPKQVNFQSNTRFILNEFKEVVNRNTTYFFRGDLNWNKFSDLLLEKYKNTNKVNLHNFACSDGSETYTLIMSILERTKNPMEIEKFFPINAQDIDENMILRANSGMCEVFTSEIDLINQKTNKNFPKYFNQFEFNLIEAKPILKDKILFKQGNVLENLKHLPDKNNVILLRNCWPYIDSKHHYDLCKTLYNKTLNNGLVVIGNFDNEKEIPELLNRFDFIETPVQNVFKPLNK